MRAVLEAAFPSLIHLVLLNSELKASGEVIEVAVVTINILEARTRLSDLVRAVETGAEAKIIIARRGKPAARLVPIQRPVDASKRFGLLDGKYPPMSLEDFNADDEEIAAMFYGEEDE